MWLFSFANSLPSERELCAIYRINDLMREGGVAARTEVGIWRWNSEVGGISYLQIQNNLRHFLGESQRRPASLDSYPFTFICYHKIVTLLRQIMSSQALVRGSTNFSGRWFCRQQLTIVISCRNFYEKCLLRRGSFLYFSNTECYYRLVSTRTEVLVQNKLIKCQL